MARESSRLVLRRAFRHLEREIPTSVTRVLRWLRHPRSRWVRIPAGILFILGGFLAILPVFGAWMIPVGLLLLAADVPFLRRPVGHSTIWATERWRGARAGIAGEASVSKEITNQAGRIGRCREPMRRPEHNLRRDVSEPSSLERGPWPHGSDEPRGELIRHWAVLVKPGRSDTPWLRNLTR